MSVDVGVFWQGLGGVSLNLFQIIQVKENRDHWVCYQRTVHKLLSVIECGYITACGIGAHQ